MADKLPGRPVQHDLATLSVRYFENRLPANWVAEPSQHDYGVDLVVSIFQDSQATRYKLIVQLKSTQEATEGDYERVALRIATYNHLMQLLDVSILVKYIAEANEAYWIFVRDIPAPNQENESFTVNIPKTNRLSQVNWNQQILTRIAPIVDGKHEAGKNF